MTMNGIAIIAFGRGSPANVLPRPSANQCTPYAVNASAACTAAGHEGAEPRQPDEQQDAREELEEARHPDAPDPGGDIDAAVARRKAQELRSSCGP